MTDKRDVLTSAMLQYAIPLQHTKRDALAQILLKIIYAAAGERPVSLDEILVQYEAATIGGLISESVARRCLRTLSEQGLVRLEPQADDAFQITGQGVKELTQSEICSKRILDTILDRHFGSNRLPATCYRSAFVEIIARIAASIGYESASFLVGKITALEMPTDLDQLTADVVGKYPHLDEDVFRGGVAGFLTSKEPESHAFLWNITQAYFVAKMLGLDSTGSQLGKEVFHRSEFIVDTNVLYALIAPSDGLHKVARATIKALYALNVRHVFLPETLDELNNVVAKESEWLERIVAKGGSRWLSRLDSPIARDFASLDRSLEEFRESHEQAEESFVQQYGFDRLNIRVSDEKEKHALGATLKIHSTIKSSGQRTKRDSVAVHDATLLLVARDRRRSTKMVTWVLSFDSVLSDVSVPEWENGALSIHPRIVLQWVGTAAGGGAQQDFADAFARLIEARFFPDDNFLRTGHFYQLLGTNEKMLSLPDHDVETVLKEIERAAPSIDLESYEGREVLAGIMGPVLLDPQSETQTRIVRERERHEEVLARIRSEQESAIVTKDDEMERLRQESKAASTRHEDERHAWMAEQQRRDREEATFRFRLFAGACLLGSVLVTYVAWYLLSVTDFSLPIRFIGTLLIFLTELGVSRLFVQQVGRKAVGEERVYTLQDRYKQFLGT